MLSPGRIVRACMITFDRGTVMFNDKIKGGNSIKVWNWYKQHYVQCANVLREHGYTVKLSFPRNSSYPRLHVYPPK